MSWLELVQQFRALGFEQDFISAIEEECPSSAVVTAILRYAELRQSNGNALAKYLEEQLNKAKTSFVPLQLHLAAENEKNAKCRLKIKALEGENENLKEKIIELQQELASCQQQVEIERATSENVGAKLSAENGFLIDGIARFRADNEKLVGCLQMTSQDLKEVSSKLERQNEQLESLRHENADLRRSMVTINAENAALKLKAGLRLCNGLENVNSSPRPCPSQTPTLPSGQQQFMTTQGPGQPHPYLQQQQQQQQHTQLFNKTSPFLSPQTPLPHQQYQQHVNNIYQPNQTTVFIPYNSLQQQQLQISPPLAQQLCPAALATNISNFNTGQRS